MRKKISLVEWNQDFKVQPIYHELRSYPKTYFSGWRMMLVTINNKILNMKIFYWLHFTPKSAKLQINSKNDLLSGPCTIFLSEILILVSSVSYLPMVKKPKWVFDGKKFNFSKQYVENFKDLEILRSKRFFQDNFDTFMLAN